jgi:hypothetical protein
MILRDEIIKIISISQVSFMKINNHINEIEVAVNLGTFARMLDSLL